MSMTDQRTDKIAITTNPLHTREQKGPSDEIMMVSRLRHQASAAAGITTPPDLIMETEFVENFDATSVMRKIFNGSKGCQP